MAKFKNIAIYVALAVTLLFLILLINKGYYFVSLVPLALGIGLIAFYKLDWYFTFCLPYTNFNSSF
ncbi:MAG: hypothetical protein HC906_04060 [Bacteroidales bacterium]|nr:hypothetical protein [Bacteroidales bacterium]